MGTAMIKNKILHIRDYYPSIENPASSPWIYDQVKSLLENRINAVVISPTPYLPKFVRSKPKFYLYPKANEVLDNYKGTGVIRPQYFKIPNNKLLSFNFQNLSKSILRSAEKLKPFALIHAHFGQNGVASLKLKGKNNIPLVTSFYGYDAGRLGSLFAPYYKKLAEKGDLFLALSEDMRNDLLNLGFPSEKIKIHHLGINPNQFKPIENKEKEKFVFLVVARLDESKGVQDVIVSFNKIKNSKMQLRIVGDGIYKTTLANLVDRLGLNKQVVFINNFKAEKPRQVVIDEMQNSDVVLLTSYKTNNGAKEGTPVVLMEAQACGKSCIATLHAGIPEVVRDNETGFLAKERDVDFIAKKMELLYNNSRLRLSMERKAIVHIQQEFNQDIQIQRLINIYNNLLE
jgi:colanic acid/amylovoran biosynthesis glycosyltransferase